jgi:hypothetical protein
MQHSSHKKIGSTSFWSREKDADARALWKAGRAASQIAAAIGASSASAVTGRARRRGWTRPAELARINHRFAHMPFEPREEPLPPSPPLAIALAPRPWLSRGPGECAFPVDGDGWTTRSCCNPCGPEAYCPSHRAITAGPRLRSAEHLEWVLRPYIG